MGIPRIGSLQRVQPVAHVRDYKAERTARRLRREYPQLRSIPPVVLKRFCQLAALSEEIRQHILTYGIATASGDPGPWLERFRASAQAELSYSRLVFGLDLKPVASKEEPDWIDLLTTVKSEETA